MTEVTLDLKDSHDFHPFILLRSLPDKGKDVPFINAATEQERATLAAWVGVTSVESFKLLTTAHVIKKDQIVEILFKLDVQYTQNCVNKGTPIEQTYQEEFKVSYLGPELFKQQEADYYDNLSNGIVLESDFEELPSDKIDIGDVAAQYFLMSLDQHPKSTLMDLDNINQKYDQFLDEETAPREKSPFEVLKDLKE